MLNPDYMPNGLPAILDYANAQSNDMLLPVLVDIAISLRVLSGRPEITDTPIHRQVRKLVKKGKDPSKDHRMNPDERLYYKAIRHYYETIPPDRNEPENNEIDEFDTIYYGDNNNE